MTYAHPRLLVTTDPHLGKRAAVVCRPCGIHTPPMNPHTATDYLNTHRKEAHSDDE